MMTHARFGFVAAAGLLLLTGLAQAADFPVGSFVCSFRPNEAATHTIKVSAVTIGGVELPLVDVRSIESADSEPGAMRGIASYSETKFGKYLAVAGSSSSLAISFENPTAPVLNWKRRYVCKAKTP